MLGFGNQDVGEGDLVCIIVGYLVFVILCCNFKELYKDLENEELEDDVEV